MFSIRNFVFMVLLCCGFAAARAWDPNKPFIYEMRIAFETDNWINMYSTATVLSKSDNSVAFRVVANSTTSPTYQLVVTTQGNVGIGTGSPSTALVVIGTVTATAFSGSGASLSGVVSGNGTVNPVNLLANGDFENWSAGTSSAPDGWGLSGAGGVAQEASIVKLGTYSLKAIKSGNDILVYQVPFSSTKIAYLQGRTITFGCWVYATAADAARLVISNGTDVASSSYHPGDSAWHWLSVTYTVAFSDTLLYPNVQVKNTITSAYFDGAMLVEGPSAFAFAPSPKDIGTSALPAPLVYANTTGSGANVYVDGNGYLYRSTSALRYKKNVRTLEIDTSKIYELTPYTYERTEDNKTAFGLVADWVYSAIPQLTVLNKEGRPDEVQYSYLPVLMLPELKKNKAQVEELKAEVAAQKAELDELKSRMAKLEAGQNK